MSFVPASLIILLLSLFDYELTTHSILMYFIVNELALEDLSPKIFFFSQLKGLDELMGLIFFA